MDRRRRLWLCWPVLLAVAGDVGMTLAGQGAAYWRGAFETAVELNPIAYPLLTRQPAWFAVYGIAWGLAVAVVILRGPARFVPMIAFAACFGHALGAGAWMWRGGVVGAVLAVCWLVGMSWWFAVAWRGAGVEEMADGASAGT